MHGSLSPFKRITEVWGEFLTLDQETIHEESFDIGRLLMVTSSKHKIDDWINITVKGRIYSVQVWEEEHNDPFDVNGLKDRDHFSNFNNEVQKSPCKDSASQIRLTTKNGIDEEEDIFIKILKMKRRRKISLSVLKIMRRWQQMLQLEKIKGHVVVSW